MTQACSSSQTPSGMEPSCPQLIHTSWMCLFSLLHSYSRSPPPTGLPGVLQDLLLGTVIYIPTGDGVSPHTGRAACGPKWV